MKRFIYKGLYYPVLGSAVGWCNGKTRCILERRVGGWENADKWWSFSYGIHVKLWNTEKPYKQCVIDAINKHPEMRICKNYWDEQGYLPSEEGAKGFMYNVETPNGDNIGDIRDAFYLTDLNDLRTSGKQSKQVCHGWNVKEQKAYGWSHRAICGFGVGDKVFSEKFGDETTPYKQHGRKDVLTYSDAMKSALAFARSVN